MRDALITRHVCEDCQALGALTSAGRAFFAVSTTALKAAGSLTASSAKSTMLRNGKRAAPPQWTTRYYSAGGTTRQFTRTASQFIITRVASYSLSQTARCSASGGTMARSIDGLTSLIAGAGPLNLLRAAYHQSGPECGGKSGPPSAQSAMGHPPTTQLCVR